MEYRNGRLEDIPKVKKLQRKYHVDTISHEDRDDGFVTTLFTDEQFKELIEKEDGLSIACDGDEIIGYAMAASWEYWSQWPLFQYMIEDLSNTEYMGEKLSVENSYQYGPICIHKDYRGSDVLPNLFEFSRRQMEERYSIMVTFINQVNGRSYKAHKDKLNMELLKTFKFNDNDYYEFVYDMSLETKGSNI